MARGGHNPAYHFHKYAAPAGATDLVDSLVPNAALIANRRGPRRIGEDDYAQAIGYSYHLDAALFAAYLRELCVGRGIHHIVDDVVEVALDERGWVLALRLERGGLHGVEFRLDCSGFAGLILNGALGEPFKPWDRHLLCDRALAVRSSTPSPTRSRSIPGRRRWARDGYGTCRCSAASAPATCSPAPSVATTRRGTSSPLT